jgi:phage host-nuclease inhibitor protein Gam
MQPVTATSVFATAESLLEKLADIELALKQHQVDVDKAVMEITAAHAVEIDELTVQRDSLVQDVVQLYGTHEHLLTNGSGKTVVLRGGTLSSREAPPSLVVDDESAAMKAIRRAGKLRMFTRAGKRTLNKTALKKDPVFVDKTPGIHIDNGVNLTITLPRAQTEIIRKLNSLRGRLRTHI